MTKARKNSAIGRRSAIGLILLALAIAGCAVVQGIHFLVADFPPFEQLGHARGKLADVTAFVEGSGPKGIAILLSTERDYICMPGRDPHEQYVDAKTFKQVLGTKIEHSKIKDVDIWYYRPEFLQRDFNRVAQLSIDGEILVHYEDQRDMWNEGHRLAGWVSVLTGLFMAAYAYSLRRYLTPPKAPLPTATA